MAKSSKDIKNNEGYTWVEWLRAVGLEVGQVINEKELVRLSLAWEMGEDPADHRRLLEVVHHAEYQRKHGPHETHDHVGKIVCTKCGNDEPRLFRYVETVETYREVQAVAGGKVIIDNLYRTGEGYDEDGKNPYFECHRITENCSPCLHRMPIPDWVYKRIEWM